MNKTVKYLGTYTIGLYTHDVNLLATGYWYKLLNYKVNFIVFQFLVGISFNIVLHSAYYIYLCIYNNNDPPNMYVYL